MTIAERKIRLATTILNEADEDVFDDLEFSEPSAEEIAEMRRKAMEAYEEFKVGKTVSHEKVKEDFELFFRNK
jgi:hypothetical protein